MEHTDRYDQSFPQYYSRLNISAFTNKIESSHFKITTIISITVLLLLFAG